MTGRRFVLVCATAVDRARVRYAVDAGHLDFPGFDHVDYHLIRAVDRTIRGLTFHGWGFTEEALAVTRGWVEDAARALRSRVAVIEPLPLYRLEEGERQPSV